MADDKFTFEQARIRLEEIASEVRKKDTSLEKSLDLLEEGVRLANICTELVDHTDFGATVTVPAAEPGVGDAQEAGAATADESKDDAAAVDVADSSDEEGDVAGSGDTAEGFDEADDAIADECETDTGD